ncbi:hypothetical protein JCM16303_005154 [Sporobolomyces ruberrimus]
MAATTRKPPTPAAGLPSKKRQRQSPRSSIATQPPPSPSRSMSPTPASPAPAPVLSAVAARRAAKLAASSASASPAPSPPRPAPRVESPRVEPHLDAEELDSDSSDSASDVEAALLSRVSAKSKAKGKGKEVVKNVKKKEPVSRYFSGVQEDEIRLEEDSSTQAEEVRDASTPRAARPRRRREKTAFVDPECYSNFRPEENVNAWSTNVSRADGSMCEGVVYGLRIGEDLVIHGNFDLTPLSGSVSLLGSTVSSDSALSDISLPTISSSSSHRVYSPASHPIAPVSALPIDPSTPKPASLSLYLDAQIDISNFSSVVLVTPVQSGIEGIESSLKSGGLGCANGLFPWPSKVTGSVSGGKSWRLVTEPIPGLTSLRSLEPWSSSLSNLVPNVTETNGEPVSVDPGRMSIVVEGPKRVGKSTFSKMLLNRLLDRYEAVAYLDTDLGQPEFSTPGFVSLNVLRKPVFGPAFTHLSLPVTSHFLGSASPASDPTSYMAAISSLLATYALEVEYPLIDEPVPSNPRRRHHLHASQAQSTRSTKGGKIRERVPLVINTQGWVKGLGADLLAKLKDASRPTHVCSFVSPIEDEAGGYSDGGGAPGPFYAPQQQYEREEGLPYELYTLPAAPSSPLESKWTASDYRTLSFVSYFHSKLGVAPQHTSSPSSTFPSTWDFSSPLVAQIPYSLGWKREAEQISSVHLLEGDDVAYEHVLHALNGALVAIVEPSSMPDHSAPTSSSRSFPYDPTATSPSPSTSRALGLALVRSVSPSTSALHVLTPIPPPSSSVSLVKGSLELPLALMLDHTANETEREQGLKGVQWKEVPFLSIEDGEGAGRRKVRRNLMRRGHA